MAQHLVDEPRSRQDRATLVREMEELEAAIASETRCRPSVATATGEDLVRAVESGDLIGVCRQLALRCEVNFVTSHGRTPLGLASCSGHLPVMEALMLNGADVELRGAKGRTPLMAAAAQGQTAAVRRLVQAGANRDSRDEDGRSAADLARQAGHGPCAEAIFGAGRRS